MVEFGVMVVEKCVFVEKKFNQFIVKNCQDVKDGIVMLWIEKDIVVVCVGIKKKWKDFKMLKGKSYLMLVGDKVEEKVQVEFFIFQVQFKMFEQYISVNDVISKQCQDFWQIENQFIVLQEVVGCCQFMVQEKFLLVYKEEMFEYKWQLVDLGDKVVRQ